MKKVIRHGYRYGMRTTCPSCGCEFSYEWEDVLKNGYECRQEGYYCTYPGYQIICPECGSKFKIANRTFSYSSIEENPYST